MADKIETAAFVYVAPDAAHAFAKTLIASYGVPDADAETVARCLVQADLRGVDTHGLMRLPGYLNRVRLGLTNKTPKLEAKPVGTAAAAVAGQNGFGFVVGTFAMSEAIRLAGLHGVGIVAARHSTHFGMAGSYVLQALEAGYVSMVFSNASPAMPPWGARTTSECTPPLPYVGDPTLTKTELDLLDQWHTIGMPEGDPKDAPPPLTPPVMGIANPTMTLTPSAPYTVANGGDQFRCFVLDPKITQRAKTWACPWWDQTLAPSRTAGEPMVGGARCTRVSSEAQDGVNLGTAVRINPQAGRSSDGVEPGHTLDLGRSRCACC